MPKHFYFAPIYGLFLSLSLIGCSQDDDRASQAQSIQSEAEAASRPETCDILSSHYNSGTANLKSEPQEIVIERHLQRVIRKDCSGTVTSDKIETVKDPHYDISLKAPKNEKKFRSVFVFNQKSCDHKLTTMPLINFPLLGLLSAVTGDGEHKILLKGDMNQAQVTFRLEKDLNQIFVRYFYDCSPENIEGNTHSIFGKGDCKNSLDSAIVEYPVKVNYMKKDLVGFREIIPSAKFCKKLKKNR